MSAAVQHGASVFDHTPESLRAWCTATGLAPYRADQILQWVYRRSVADPSAMTTLPRADRTLVARDLRIRTAALRADLVATDATRKLLLEWPGPGAQASLPVLGGDASRRTECVMIPGKARPGARTRRTACVSSQIGCPVGCRFCASGIGGLDGNLTAAQIVEQVWLLDHLVRKAEALDARAITHVVFMGMGEPLANLGNVVRAIRTIASPWGMGISARRITVSTVGLPAAIERLAEDLDLPVTLALSLHAPDDDLRRQLIPWAHHATIAQLLSACRKWFDKTGREITLEYILLGGVNDRPEHARRLAEVARTLRANVNLIRYNEVAGLPYRRPRTSDVLRFQQALRTAHVNAHIRASRGRDIAAACGQLRHEHAKAQTQQGPPERTAPA